MASPPLSHSRRYVEATLGQLNLLTRGESMVAAYERQHAMRFDVMIRMRFDFCAYTDFQLPSEAFTRGGLDANTVRGWRRTAVVHRGGGRLTNFAGASFAPPRTCRQWRPLAPHRTRSFWLRLWRRARGRGERADLCAPTAP